MRKNKIRKLDNQDKQGNNVEIRCIIPTSFVVPLGKVMLFELASGSLPMDARKLRGGDKQLSNITHILMKFKLLS